MLRGRFRGPDIGGTSEVKTYRVPLTSISTYTYDSVLFTLRIITKTLEVLNPAISYLA